MYLQLDSFNSSRVLPKFTHHKPSLYVGIGLGSDNKQVILNHTKPSNLQPALSSQSLFSSS